MAKTAAYNTRIQITDPADSSIIRVKHLGDISGPEVSVAVVDATSHDSPDGFTESLAGIAEAGDVTFELFFDPNDNGHSRLLAMVDERRPAAFAILLPGSSAEFISLPNFQSPLTNWTELGAGFNLAVGLLSYSSVDPPGNEYVQVVFNQPPLVAESYVLAITFSSGSNAGTADLEVLHGGTLVGTVNPSVGGTQYVRWDATSASTQLRLQVNSTVSTQQAFAITRVSVTGISNNADSRFDFTGLITKVGILASVGDALKAPVSVKVSGKPVYTPI